VVIFDFMGYVRLSYNNFIGHGKSVLVLSYSRVCFSLPLAHARHTISETVVTSEESIAISMMGSDKVKIIRFTDLKVNDMNAYYELAVDRKGTQRKYLLTKKSLPHELERFLKRLIEQL
jgi:hypothetical protein